MPDGEVGRYETAARFLGALFGQVDDQSGLLIWTARQGAKKSHWPGSVEAAARFAASADRETNVYVGCGWRHAPLGRHARGAFPEIAGIPALWIDLDVAGDGHGSKPYPPSFEEARSLVVALPLPPSIVVNSGGGLHLWWRFREPWQFESDADRLAAAELARAWEATVQQHAAERGWTIDSVHDLPRVLRVPGTWRSKPGLEPIFVDIESDNGSAYLAADFETYLVETVGRGRQAVTPTIEVGAVVLHPDAQPPPDKLIALCQIEPRFDRSWAHKRTDFPRDDSESAYDISCATYAAQAEWTDQEIANLIIARRRNAGVDVAKALRHDYIRDRIRHARASVAAARVRADARVQADIKTVELEQSLNEMDAAVDRGSGSTEILAYLSEMLGVEVVRWTQATRHQPYYELHLRDGMAIAVGDVRNVTEQRRFANAVYAHTGRLIGPYTPKDWARICRALGQVVEITDAGSASREGQVVEWLDQYAADAPDLKDADYETLRRNKPFRKGGRLFVHLGDFLKWVTIKQQTKVPRTELLATMKLVGFTATHAGARNEVGQNCTRHYWAATEPLLSDSSDVFTVSTEGAQDVKTTFRQS